MTKQRPGSFREREREKYWRQGLLPDLSLGNQNEQEYPSDNSPEKTERSRRIRETKSSNSLCWKTRFL